MARRRVLLHFLLGALPSLSFAQIFFDEAAGDYDPVGPDCPDNGKYPYPGDNYTRQLAGDGPTWYCEPWEKDTLVAIFAIVMILVAVLFDEIYHLWMHKSQHSYVYGNTTATKEELAVKRQERYRGKPLMESLMHRMGSEFMSLGFLAFCVWSSNQLGFFQWLVGLSPTLGKIHLPQTSSDYLHLAEEVHMQLFIAMLLYFTFCYRAIRGCIAHINYYEQLRNGRAPPKVMSPSFSNIPEHPDVFALANFMMTEAQMSRKQRSLIAYWQHFCVQGLEIVMTWREEDPEVFGEIIEAVQIVDAPEDVVLEDLQEAFDAHFVFETYLAYEMRLLAEEMIGFQSVELIMVAVFKAAEAGLKYAFQWSHSDVSLAIIFGVGGLMLLAWIWLEVHRVRLEKNEWAAEARKVPSIHWQTVDWEEWCGRILQGALFFYCFALAASIVDRSFWQAVLIGRLAEVNFWFSVISLVLLYIFIWHIAPAAGTILALPPFFDAKDKRCILRVLRGNSVMMVLHLPTAEASENAVKDEVMQGLAKAVRVFVSGRDEDKNLGPRERYQEKLVVNDLQRLLTNWKHGLNLEAPDADRDTRVAQRLEDLHRVLEAMAPSYDLMRQQSQLMRLSPSRTEGRGRGSTSSLRSVRVTDSDHTPIDKLHSDRHSPDQGTIRDHHLQVDHKDIRQVKLAAWMKTEGGQLLPPTGSRGLSTDPSMPRHENSLRSHEAHGSFLVPTQNSVNRHFLPHSLQHRHSQGSSDQHMATSTRQQHMASSTPNRLDGMDTQELGMIELAVVNRDDSMSSASAAVAYRQSMPGKQACRARFS